MLELLLYTLIVFYFSTHGSIATAAVSAGIPLFFAARL